MARVPKVASGKISLARGIRCYPILSYFFFQPVGSRYTDYATRPVYVHTHISDCVQTVYELSLLANNTANETFLHKSGALRIVERIFIIGTPACA